MARKMTPLMERALRRLIQAGWLRLVQLHEGTARALVHRGYARWKFGIEPKTATDKLEAVLFPSDAGLDVFPDLAHYRRQRTRAGFDTHRERMIDERTVTLQRVMGGIQAEETHEDGVSRWTGEGVDVLWSVDRLHPGRNRLEIRIETTGLDDEQAGRGSLMNVLFALVIGAATKGRM